MRRRASCRETVQLSPIREPMDDSARLACAVLADLLLWVALEGQARWQASQTIHGELQQPSIWRSPVMRAAIQGGLR